MVSTRGSAVAAITGRGRSVFGRGNTKTACELAVDAGVPVVPLAPVAVGGGQVEGAMGVFACAPRPQTIRGQHVPSRALLLSRVPGLQAGVGLFCAPGALALLAQSRLERDGADSVASFARAEACRGWGATHPLARHKAPLLHDSHLTPAFLVESLRAVGCALRIDIGAEGVIRLRSRDPRAVPYLPGTDRPPI